MNKKKEISLSKFLSLVLRHNPKLIELDLDKNGWAKVEDLITKCKTKGKIFDFEELKYIVQNCNKQRYTFNEDLTKIRANQGHSINVDLEFEPKKPPAILFHGTAGKNLESILENGLIKQSRQHVHLSLDLDTAINVGQRHGKVVVLEIKSGEMYKAGYTFYLSKNNVWLTNKVEPKYLSIYKS